MKFPVFKILKNSRRLTVVVALGALVIILGGSSAYAAHSNALPGSAFYPLKQLWEQGSLALAFTPAAKAQVHLNIAQDRIKATQSNTTPALVLAPTLQTVQQNLNDALNQTKNISDPSQRKDIEKSISDAATEVEKEAERENESESSSSDKQDIQSSRDQIKQVKDQTSTDN